MQDCYHLLEFDNLSVRQNKVHNARSRRFNLQPKPTVFKGRSLLHEDFFIDKLTNLWYIYLLTPVFFAITKIVFIPQKQPMDILRIGTKP
ncbi:MAG: hypothetical protein F6K39_47910 [Okeania sp. SIO3B3]|nr:hypothetical protein [Okeania sp. SIO3B3]